MPLDYGSADIKCPFYKSETRNAIKCEGVFSKTCIFNFANATKKCVHKEKYCNRFNYKECPHAKNIKNKYPLK